MFFLSIWLFFFSFWTPDNYRLLRILFLVYGLYFLYAPYCHSSIRYMSDAPRYNSPERGLFKKVKAPPFLSRFIFGAKKKKRDTTYLSTVLLALVFLTHLTLLIGVSILVLIDQLGEIEIIPQGILADMMHTVFVLYMLMAGLTVIMTNVFDGDFKIKKKSPKPARLELAETKNYLHPIRSIRDFARELHHTLFESGKHSHSSSASKNTRDMEIMKYLKHFQSYKERGVYYIRQSDLPGIEQVLSERCRNIAVKTKVKDGRNVFSVRDSDNGQLIFEAPVKENK